MQKNLETIRANIARACRSAGRDCASVQILAATKTVPADTVALLPQCGIRLAGENRVQELLGKMDSVQNVDWHFIGSLQTNKVKDIVGRVSLIHSLDRKNLADEIQKQSERKGLVTECLIEINAGGEANKSGVLPGDAEELYRYVQTLSNIRVRGFMPVFPIAAQEYHYQNMQRIFSEYANRDSRITILSMGMSGDYETAVRYGATMVRLGSCIFGERRYE